MIWPFKRKKAANLLKNIHTGRLSSEELAQSSSTLFDWYLNRLGLERPEGMESKKALLHAFESDGQLFRQIGADDPDINPNLHGTNNQRLAGGLNDAAMIVDIVDALGERPSNGWNWLDFGGASGRVTRALQPYYSNDIFYLCDPREGLINWLNETCPHVHAFCSPHAPPIDDIEDGRFNFVISISVLAHFSEERTVAWFTELGRILKRGGYVLFTTHGYTSLKKYHDVEKVMTDERYNFLVDKLEGPGFNFNGFPKTNYNNDLDLEHFGMTYYSPAWFERSLGGLYVIEGFLPGRLNNNQDVFVVRKK